MDHPQSKRVCVRCLDGLRLGKSTEPSEARHEPTNTAMASPVFIRTVSVSQSPPSDQFFLLENPGIRYCNVHSTARVAA